MKTTLTAVNDILRRVGKPPVSALDTNGSSTHAHIERFLSDASRDVQKRGWQWNTKYNVEAAPSTNLGQINVSDLETTDVFNIDTYGADTNKNVTRQGQFLFDLDNNTNVFTSAVKVQYSYEVTFPNVPDAFQDWIIAKAAVEFSYSFDPDQARVQRLQNEVQNAEVHAKRAEMRAADVQVLDTPALVQVRGRPRTTDRSVY
jgi:hypothetical protein